MPLHLKCLQYFTAKGKERRASQDFNIVINDCINRFDTVIKLLLLGAGESGKTTVIKQMKILHIQGFKDEERKNTIHDIRINMLEAIQMITTNMSKLVPPIILAKHENSESLQFIEKFDINDCGNIVFDKQFYKHLKKLWSDEGVQESYRRSYEYSLIDCGKYFLQRLDDIMQDDYIPNDQDILRCRKKTCDIQKIEFEVKIPGKYGAGSQMFWMFDVGGQRSERKKWIQVFDDITAVLFIVSSSGFDRRIREDNNTCCLEESVKLFENVWQSRFLHNTSFILFLNKQDILKEKIKNGISLSKYYHDYENYIYDASNDPDNYNSDDFEYKKARSYIRDKFLAITKKSTDNYNLSLNTYHKPYCNHQYNNNRYDNYQYDRNQQDHTQANAKNKRSCYWHYTTATDTGNIKKVFQNIHKTIILSNIKQTSIS